MLAVVALLGLGLASPAAAQSGVIRGRVIDSAGVAVSGAIVTVDRTALRTASTTDGRYVLRGVPVGPQTVRVRAIGFQPTTVEVLVRAAADATADVTVSRSPVQLAPIDVVVGSRARHSAADELAVPVDVFPAEVLTQQGTTEVSAILQAVSPSVNFPRQSVTDADDIVRPFTMRGLSPDHTLVLVNGLRRHRTALVHTFAFGMAPGSTGTDLNALPASAIDRIEVLRDGASAQYGADAIAGVVNLVMKDGVFAPFGTVDFGRYATKGYPDDGATLNGSGGWGFKVGRGSLGIFGEYRYREPTNRAWPEEADQITPGDADDIDDDGRIISKNNPVDQPNHHWGDGLAKDLMTFANFRLPLNPTSTAEFYANGGWTHRIGTGNGFYRQGISDRNWPTIYPEGFLPEFRPTVGDISAAAGFRGGSTRGWNYDVGASFGRSTFDYRLNNTLNTSLGPCLTAPCAPGLDGIFGNSDDPGFPNQTSFFAGALRANELSLTANVAKPLDWGLPNPVNVAAGIAYRRETYSIQAGEPASYIQGGHLNRNGEVAPPGSQVFSGFLPSTEVDESRGNVGAYLDLESDLSNQLLVNLAGRFENYSDFGSRFSGKLALRYQPAEQIVFRGALSTGFRAPSLAQSFYGSRITTFVLDQGTGRQTPFEVGIFPVNDAAARSLGSTALKAERAVNLSGGLAWSPTDRLTITIDGYQINLKDRILLTGFIAGDSVEKILAAAGIQAVAAQYFTNIIDTRTNGIDITANYRTALGPGALTLNGGFNYTTNEITDQRPLPEELEGTGAELVDRFTTVALEQERPKWRGTVTANYTRERFHGLLRSSLYGKFTSLQLGLCDACEQRYGAKMLLDAEVGRQFGQVKFSIGARNLLDTYPDRASVDNSFGIFPWPGPSPFGFNGRFIYTRFDLTFRR
jgi:iron complex outermembrane receptor protein